jgi:hypothetical protein
LYNKPDAPNFIQSLGNTASASVFNAVAHGFVEHPRREAQAVLGGPKFVPERSPSRKKHPRETKTSRRLTWWIEARV